MLGSVVDWQALLQFWFEMFTDDGFAQPQQRKKWFVADQAFDDHCEEAYASTLESVQQGGVDQWLAEPEGRLA